MRYSRLKKLMKLLDHLFISSHPSGLLVELFLELQAISTNVLTTPRIFQIDFLEHRERKARPEEVRKESVLQWLRQVIACNSACLEAGGHQVNESLHSAILNNHFGVERYVLQRSEAT